MSRNSYVFVLDRRSNLEMFSLRSSSAGAGRALNGLPNKKSTQETRSSGEDDMGQRGRLFNIAFI